MVQGKIFKECKEMNAISAFESQMLERISCELNLYEDIVMFPKGCMVVLTNSPPYLAPIMSIQSLLP